jgi:putative transposase
LQECAERARPWPSDDFIDCYNNERPHQALNMQYPAERYVPSTRAYQGLPDFDYPFHDKTITVTTCGRICFNRQKINLSVVFAGQSVGIKQVSDETWLISFMDDLGYFDQETCRLEPIENPFGPKVLPMSPVRNVTYVSGRSALRFSYLALSLFSAISPF